MKFWKKINSQFSPINSALPWQNNFTRFFFSFSYLFSCQVHIHPCYSKHKLHILRLFSDFPSNGPRRRISHADLSRPISVDCQVRFMKIKTIKRDREILLGRFCRNAKKRSTIIHCTNLQIRTGEMNGEKMIWNGERKKERRKVKLKNRNVIKWIKKNIANIFCLFGIDERKQEKLELSEFKHFLSLLNF